MMYLPSLPSIVSSLNTTRELVQLSLPIFLLGLSVSTLFNGPISDAVGRRKPIFSGLLLCNIGTLICYFAPTISYLLIGRLLEGIGVGACIVVFRSIARDLLSKNELAKFFSQVGMFDICIIGVSLVLGGYIRQFTSWREVFLVIFIYTTCIWILAIFKLPETNLVRQKHHLMTILKNFKIVMSNRTFIGNAISVAGAFTGLTAYQVIGPFLLQQTIGLSPVQFGWLGVLVALIIFLSAFANNRYVKNFSYQQLLKVGVLFMFTGGLCMIILGVLGYVNAYAVMIPVLIFDFGFGLTFINGLVGALEVFPEMAGTAGAMLGFIQIAIASIFSAFFVVFTTSNQTPLGMIYLLISLVIYLNIRLAKI